MTDGLIVYLILAILTLVIVLMALPTMLKKKK
ncbi:MAG: hypothetical protein UV59_C0009G0017 [Candidatus Gottesmanbacteria bacterium GW2011_GWA1_43_11]|uniref:Uncharacterized protein n=1 Tax=Candidatus Gottesmanbacteria bacterium GW2011_GWA1_43_11 TaxID=1618436 RepID=A0A0G1CHF4_9BACT|nr:MAG: hypothetical protein UV59_C0009G0017 [Candidatus Gottesmanbacteria bacterium GW2011_GWA1_43_11]